MAQFAAIIVQAVYVLSPACGATPRAPWIMTLVFMAVFYALFAHFRSVELARLAKLKQRSQSPAVSQKPKAPVKYD